MAKATKMVRLAVDETSGVDHPAHLSEGWLVMKSANAEEIEAVIDSLTETTITKEDSVSDESTVVTEDAVVAEAPVAEATETESPAVDKDARIAELEAEVEKAKKMPAFMTQGKDESDEEYKKRMKKMEDEEEEKAMAKKPMMKSLESVEKAFAVEKARADEAVALLQKERDERADADAIAKAKNWNNLPLEAEKVGPALRRLALIDEDLTKSIEGILEAVNAQAKTSNLFAEIGKSVDSSATDAYDRLTALAKAAVESGVAPSFEVAMADAALANTDLYKQYLTEKGAK
jgi:predicted secreted protein